MRQPTILATNNDYRKRHPSDRVTTDCSCNVFKLPDLLGSDSKEKPAPGVTAALLDTYASFQTEEFEKKSDYFDPNSFALEDHAIVNRNMTTFSDNRYPDAPKAKMSKIGPQMMGTAEMKLRAVRAFQSEHEKRTKRVKDEVSSFCTQTSFTAITNIYNASSLPRRIGWTLLFFAMLAWLCVQCYWLQQTYFSYPTKVTMDIVVASDLDFPSVSVCNVNPIKESEMLSRSEFSELKALSSHINDKDMLFDFISRNANEFYSSGSGSPAGLSDSTTPSTGKSSTVKPAGNSSTAPTTSTPSSVSSTGTTGTTGTTVHPATNSDSSIAIMMNNSFNKWNALENGSLGVSYYKTRGFEFKAMMAYATLGAKLDPEVVKAAGHSADDFILNCWYYGYPCSPRNFTYFHNYRYGNCYTFNSHDVAKVQNTKFPGPEYGLTLELYIQQKEYVPTLASEAGVRVVIHHRNITPFPVDNGFSISPGHSTYVSIRHMVTNRLHPPHGACNDELGYQHDMYALNSNASYSKLSCLKSCYQAIVERHCNCSVPSYYVVNRDNVCNMTDDIVNNCHSSLMASFPEEYDTCDKNCPLPCKEFEYDVLVSSAAWPSENYEGYLKTKLKQANYMLMANTNGDDFVKLTVYFRDLLSQTIDQEKAYEIENLLSDIGGQLGLWLGLSVITLGEICGFLLAIFRSLTYTSVEPKKSSAPAKLSAHPELLETKNGDVMLTDLNGYPY